jgi:hypothetical protein
LTLPSPAEASTPEEKAETGFLRAAIHHARNGEARFLYVSRITVSPLVVPKSVWVAAMLESSAARDWDQA